MLSPPLSNFKMEDVLFLLALRPSSRSHTQHFNSETECAAQKLFLSELQPIQSCKALCSLESSLCMVAGICHAPPPDQACFHHLPWPRELMPRHGLSYSPLDPKQTHKHPGPQMHQSLCLHRRQGPGSCVLKTDLDKKIP